MNWPSCEVTQGKIQGKMLLGIWHAKLPNYKINYNESNRVIVKQTNAKQSQIRCPAVYQQLNFSSKMISSGSEVPLTQLLNPQIR